MKKPIDPAVEFDPAADFWRQLDEPVIDLEDRQTVCQMCHLAHWAPLRYCPQCDERASSRHYRMLADEKARAMERVRPKPAPEVADRG